MATRQRGRPRLQQHATHHVATASQHDEEVDAANKASLLDISSPLSSADQLSSSLQLVESPVKHVTNGLNGGIAMRPRGHSIGSSLSNRTTLYNVDTLEEQPHAAWLRDAAAQAAKAAVGSKKRWSTWTATTLLSSGGEVDDPFDREEGEQREAAGALLFSSDEYTEDIGGTSGTSDSAADEVERSPLRLGHTSTDQDEDEIADAALDAAIAASQRALDMANALLHSTLSARSTFARLHAAESALEASLDVREERLRAQLTRSNEACASVSRASLELRSLAVPISSAAPTRPAHWRMPSSGASAKPMATVFGTAERGTSTTKAWLEASDKDATIGKTAARRLERVLSASHAAAAVAAAEAEAAVQEAEDDFGSVVDSRRTSVTSPSSTTHSRAPSISVSNADSTHSRAPSLNARDALAALTLRARSPSGASSGAAMPSRTASMQRGATAPPPLSSASGFTFPASVSASSSAARKQRSTLRIASLTGSGFEPTPTSSASLSVDYNSPERCASPSDAEEVRHSVVGGARSPAFPFSNWSMRERNDRPGSRASLASLGSLASIDERERSSSGASSLFGPAPPMLSPSLSTASSSRVSPTSGVVQGWTSTTALRSVSGSSHKTVTASTTVCVSAASMQQTASPSAALLAAKLRTCSSSNTRSPRLARTRAGHSSSGSVSADAQGLLTSPALGHRGEGEWASFSSGESDQEADERDASLVRVRRRRRRSKALGALEALRKVQAGGEEESSTSSAATITKEQTGYGWGGLASWVRGGGGSTTGETFSSASVTATAPTSTS